MQKLKLFFLKNKNQFSQNKNNPREMNYRLQENNNTLISHMVIANYKIKTV